MKGESMQNVVIYTDGSCLGNPGPGGYATVLLTEYKGKQYRKELCGHEVDTTNNRMELKAVITALAAIKQPCNLLLYTDSEYVSKNYKYAPSWKAKGWKGVKNADLWEELLAQATRSNSVITMSHVQAHAGVELNEYCDTLAKKQAAVAKAKAMMVL